MSRLTPDDVACWVLKTSMAPRGLLPGWVSGTSADLDRCVRRSYRLGLIAPGQPCLLWLSGRADPGVHALGVVADAVREADGGPVVPLRLTLLAEPIARAELLADASFRAAEVLRMPAGSNPSWLTATQYAAVLARVGPAADDLARPPATMGR